jgi:HEPN domain-containing protein
MANIEESAQEWLSISEYDLETAKAMLDASRYLYVAFLCQQTIEKLLKAIFVYTNQELPPRTHNLLYLVDKLGLEVSEQQRKLFARLNQYYLESRYPGERVKLQEEMDKTKAEDFYTSTEETWKCLKKLLTWKK